MEGGRGEIEVDRSGSATSRQRRRQAERIQRPSSPRPDRMVPTSTAWSLHARCVGRRLTSPDAAEWDTHQNWPPPKGVTVRSEPSPYDPSPGQTALAERSKREREAHHAALAELVCTLETELGGTLDALPDDAIAELLTGNRVSIQYLQRQGRGRDSPIRGVLLNRLSASLAREVTPAPLRG